MKTTVFYDMFKRQMLEKNEDWKDDKACQALYDHLLSEEANMGIEQEFDPVSICIEYKYFSWEEFESLCEEYNLDPYKVKVWQSIQDHYTVIAIDLEGFAILSPQ